MLVTHIPLAQRKVLFARYALHRTLRHGLELTEDATTRRGIARIRDTCASHANDLVNNANDVPLDRAAKQVYKKFDTLLCTELNDSCRREILDILRSDLERNLRGIDCHQCATTKGNRICCGGSHDDLCVHDEGACFRPFKELFDIAASISRQYYNFYVPEFTQLTRIFPCLHSSYVKGRPHGLSHPAAAGGVTFFERKGAQEFTSTIKVTLQVSAFDWSTYQALIYVFLHECFCHVYQGMRGGPGLRGAVDKCDPYTEGWMDWLAIKVLEEVDRDAGPASNLNKPEPFSNYITESRDFHRARHRRWEEIDIEHEEVDEALAVFKGGTAAARTFEAIKRYSIDDPWPEFLRLSLSLNLESLETEQKDRIVDFCYRSFRPPEQEKPEPPQYFLALEALRRYQSTADVSELLQRSIM